MASYRDISLNFSDHPGTGDVSSVKDEAAVAQSIRGIVLTNTGERFFNPDLGGNIKALLFENWSPIVKSELEDRIETAITNYEPRANLIDIEATDNPSKNSVDITIIYRTNTSIQDAKVNIALKRIF